MGKDIDWATGDTAEEALACLGGDDAKSGLCPYSRRLRASFYPDTYTFNEFLELFREAAVSKDDDALEVLARVYVVAERPFKYIAFSYC